MKQIDKPKSHALAASPPPPRAGAEISLAARLEERLTRIEPGIYRWPAGRGLTPLEAVAIGDAIEATDLALDTRIPVDGGTAIERIAEQVFASFKARDAKTTEQAIYDGYLVALAGRCQTAAFAAVRRIMRSEAPAKYSRTFVPTPGELAELAMAIESEWQNDRDRLARLLLIQEQPAPAPEPRLTAAERTRLDAAVKSVGRARR